MITRESPAKVNLCLRVLRKREDGYHDILSLMQRISLCDEMTFASAAGGIEVLCPGSGLPEGQDNIAHRAATAFFSRIGEPPGIKITIRKRIPIGAGLGGGSSNAATTLLTLNEMHGSPLALGELMKIGAAIGADVPFFLFEKSSWASGIGDILTEAPPFPTLWFVLINPGFEISTKIVYQGLNFGLTKETIKYSIPRFHTVGDLIQGLSNDLERVTLRMHPVLDQMKTFLLKSGAQGALMTGSGPTVFGLFTDEKSACEAERNIGQRPGWRVFRAKSL